MRARFDGSRRWLGHQADSMEQGGSASIRPGAMPDAASCSAAARATSRNGRGDSGRRITAAAQPAPDTAAATSSPISYRRARAHGPTAATIVSACAPSSRTIAPTAAGITPSAMPRQPAWIAATAPVAVHASSTGAQSAVRTAQANEGSALMTASASGASWESHPDARATDEPCTCLASCSLDPCAIDAAVAASSGRP